MQNLNSLYQETINLLKAGQRPYLVLEQNIIEEIKNCFTEQNNLKSVLCVLAHTRDPLPEMTQHLIGVLENCTEQDILIFALEVTHKHIITEHFRQGIKLPQNYLIALKKLFKTDDWELREWLLRTVEATGSNAIFFKEEIMAIRPNLLSVFNVHARYCVEIIQLLAPRLNKK